MTYNLIAATDAHMTRKKFGLPRPLSFFPSEASVQFEDQFGIKRTEGTCLRQAYYRLTGTPGAVAPDPYSEWIFALGKAVEKILVEQWLEMGIWVANNVKFYDKEHNISGELDLVLSEPDGTLFGGEVKSYYGYNATKEICGNKHTKGGPKTSQLLQTLIYVDLCKKLGLIQYFKMVYYARDSGNRTEFDITLTEDGDIQRPTINGEIDWRFTIQDIYDRYATLQGYLDSHALPPKDYEDTWSPEKIELEKKLGLISQSKYDDWKKNPAKNPISNWQCSYCPYHNICKKEPY